MVDYEIICDLICNKYIGIDGIHIIFTHFGCMLPLFGGNSPVPQIDQPGFVTVC